MDGKAPRSAGAGSESTAGDRALAPEPACPPGAQPFGIYLHFPYCLSKCPYCDFASRAAAIVPQERYTQAVRRELELRASEFPRRAATSVFFGGGTPSLWEAREVGGVLQALDRAYPFTADCEITLEANPGASDEARFAAYRAAGVNRLSVGAQSFQPSVLQNLGRRHTPDETARAVQAARAAGFENVSVDLIYGAPGHTGALVLDDARRAVALGTEHVSAYALTLEHLAEEVPMARDRRRGLITVPDDDTQAQMGAVLRAELERAGLKRYEISNFAHPGREARHNLNYWRGGGYLGLGVSASGFARASDGRRGRRYTNRRAPESYFAALDRRELPEKEQERIGTREVLLERLYTGLRLTEGLDLATLDGLCGTAICRTKAQELTRFAAGGLCTWDGTRITLTERGLDLHTSIAAALTP